MPGDHGSVGARERGLDLLLTVERQAGESLRAQLERQLRDGIRAGRFGPGTVLPSTRALAVQLSVSRGVVVDVYAQLAAEGFIGSRPGGKTRVLAVPSGVTTHPGPPERVTGPTAMAGSGSTVNLLPMAGDLTAFPRQAWTRGLRRALEGLTAPELSYGDMRGPRAARQTLATYLARSRGVVAAPETTAVVGGVTQALGLIARILVARGVTAVAVEDPGFPPHRAVLEDAGLRIVCVAVDEDGLRVADLEATSVGAVLVTPAHQAPLGCALSATRRTALVGWAARHGAVVIEDDYDGEFRYDGAVVGALQGLAPGHVLYLGSVSKTLAPALRIGWIVAPAAWLEELASRRWLRDGGTAAIEPLALASLIERGEYDRHLRAQRRRYGTRRARVVAALAHELPDAEIVGVAAGLHVAVVLPQAAEPAAVMAEAAQRGLLVLAGTRGTDQPDRRTIVIVGFGQLPDSAVDQAIHTLAEAVRQAGEATG